MADSHRTFGLIGVTLKHSFSKQYFTEKFQKEQITDCSYQLFELAKIHEIESLIQREHPAGLNVTIPYKLEIMPYLSQIDVSARKVGAVNVVKFQKDGTSIGYNSDYFGFKTSLVSWLPKNVKKALILGTGGASLAARAVLEDLEISYTLISRREGEGVLSYNQLAKLPELIKTAYLIINTTPLGMHPDLHTSPAIDYKLLTNAHYLYDLVYNPEFTQFMMAGQDQQAKVKNGLEMLYLQAEKSWEIWNN